MIGAYAASVSYRWEGCQAPTWEGDLFNGYLANSLCTATLDRS